MRIFIIILTALFIMGCGENKSSTPQKMQRITCYSGGVIIFEKIISKYKGYLDYSWVDVTDKMGKTYAINADCIINNS